MINDYQSKILDIYSKIRDDEANALIQRKNEIQKLYPAIFKIDMDIQKLSV